MEIPAPLESDQQAVHRAFREAAPQGQLGERQAGFGIGKQLEDAERPVERRDALRLDEIHGTGHTAVFASRFTGHLRDSALASLGTDYDSSG